MKKKHNLFNKDGKIQISKFNPDLIQFNPSRIKEIGEHNTSLEKAEVISQEVLQLEFSI